MRRSRASSSEAAGGINVAAMSDETLRVRIIELFSDMERLRATLRDLKVRREGMSHPGMFETDIHEIFINGAAFGDALEALQSCQQQQKALLKDSARVSSLCPKEYPELLRLSVEVMTAFSRLATRPGDDAPPEDIADASDAERQRMHTAAI